MPKDFPAWHEIHSESVLYKGCGRMVRESNLICINALLNKLKIPGTTPPPPSQN